MDTRKPDIGPGFNIQIRPNVGKKH